MMGKLGTRDNGTNRQLKPQIYQSKRGGQSRNFSDTCNYGRGNYQIDIDQITETGEFNLEDKVEIDQGMSKFIGMIIGEEVLGLM